MKVLRLIGFCCFLASLLLNFLQARSKHVPIVYGGWITGIRNETVKWDDNTVSFSGVPVCLYDKASNLKEGYSSFSGRIRQSYQGQGLECQVTNELILGNRVVVDDPFEAANRTCEILAFDASKKEAMVKSKGMIFSLSHYAVDWKDSRGSGPMVSAFEYVNNFKEYH